MQFFLEIERDIFVSCDRLIELPKNDLESFYIVCHALQLFTTCSSKTRPRIHSWAVIAFCRVRAFICKLVFDRTLPEKYIMANSATRGEVVFATRKGKCVFPYNDTILPRFIHFPSTTSILSTRRPCKLERPISCSKWDPRERKVLFLTMRDTSGNRDAFPRENSMVPSGLQ